MVARARRSTTTLLEKKFSEGYKRYRKNLKKEAAELKQRLRGTMGYVSVKYFDQPQENEDGSMKLDDFGMQVKKLMKSVAPPYRNKNRLMVKMDREHRRIQNRLKAKQRKLEASHA